MSMGTKRDRGGDIRTLFHKVTRPYDHVVLQGHVKN